MYSECVSIQLAKMEVASKAEYQALQLATENARDISADARYQLERHCAEHGC